MARPSHSTFAQPLAGLAAAIESPLTVRWTTLLVFAGSYLGARAGVWLQFPAVGAAVLFLPYAVLGTALIVSPARHWWIYLLASSLGNFVPHLGDNGNVGFVLSAEAANYARALVAAVAMRALGVRGLHDLRGMSIFLVFAAGLAPATGALLGALAVTHASPSADFGLVWAEWFLSNALTALTLFPVLLSAAQDARAATSDAQPWRRLEALAILAGLLAAGAGAFALYVPDVKALPLQLHWPLPFLLWGAVRFKPAFTAAALLLVTALAVWGALHGSGPFTLDSPTHNLLNLQLFLAALSLPLLLLSALMQQARRTAAELRASRAQYRSIVEDQTEMICRFLPDGSYTFVNSAYAAFYGDVPEAFVGRAMQAMLPPAAYAATQSRALAITRESPLVTRDVEAFDAAGDRRWQQWRDRGLFDREGRIVEYQSVGRDVTDRRRAEEEGRRLDAQTQIALTLREADRRKDEFLAMLGHELRNPLAPVGLALEVLRHRPLDADTRHAYDVIARQVGHMTRLVDDLLDVSRITRGQIELRLATVDLREVVAQGIETAQPAIAKHGHQIMVVLPETPLWVRGDAARLAQVVGNLLHNAAKYTDPAGRIEVSAQRHGERIVLAVRDNGIGIPAEMLSGIFELFAQAPNRGSAVRDGLGIGLTLVQRLAELHGGSVLARSDGPGHGSAFTVELPALDVVAPHVASGVAQTQPQGPRHKILIVDDNVDAASALSTLLARWGHDTKVAHDGAAALEAAAAFAPNVALLDLGLPLIDGYEVARQLRRTHDPSRLLLVALTGFGQQQHLDLARNAGFDHHLVKPADIPKLRALLGRSATGPSGAS